GAVVEDDEFEVGVVLAEEIRHRSRHEGPAVGGRHQAGDEGLRVHIRSKECIPPPDRAGVLPKTTTLRSCDHPGSAILTASSGIAPSNVDWIAVAYFWPRLSTRDVVLLITWSRGPQSRSAESRNTRTRSLKLYSRQPKGSPSLMRAQSSRIAVCLGWGTVALLTSIQRSVVRSVL